MRRFLLDRAAHEVTIHKASQVFNFCAIVNAKSGRCSENCHWCAQSRHFEGQCEIYPLLEAKKIIEAALIAQRSGATRFSLVTSGRKLSRREVREAAEIVRELKKETSLEICLSAGLLTAEEFQLLAQAGVCRCHCNLETCENFSHMFVHHTPSPTNSKPLKQHIQLVLIFVLAALSVWVRVDKTELNWL